MSNSRKQKLFDYLTDKIVYYNIIMYGYKQLIRG